MRANTLFVFEGTGKGGEEEKYEDTGGDRIQKSRGGKNIWRCFNLKLKLKKENH